MSQSHLSNNLEKIIQLISIEQLMGLMKQMKNTNIDNIFQEMNNIVPEKTTTETSQLEQINNTLLLIFDKIVSIESEIQSLKQTRQSENCDEEHIKLKIEEKDIIVAKDDIVIDNLNMNIEDEDEADNEDMEKFLSKIDEAIAEMEKKADKMEVVVEAVIENSREAEKDHQYVISEKEEEVASEKEEEEEVEEVEEEVEEAEDDTEEEISDEEEVVLSTNEKEEEVLTAAVLSAAENLAVVNLAVLSAAENLAENLEEEEEVFEIEIDDVTYFATHEENGILYEVDENGEPGKKVGIIKDGEPIFS